MDWQLRAGHRLAVAVASSNAAWALPDDDPGMGVHTLDLADSRLKVPVSEGLPISWRRAVAP